ncbi:MAG: tetratricopeptide repeat protein, partial [Thermoanaerobaculia bacterium]
GFHLKAGDYILSGLGFPKNDSFTYTINDHPYIDTSWGYQVLVSIFQKIADSKGIVLFHIFLIFGIFFFIYKTILLSNYDFISLPIFFLLGIFACEIRFEARPEILSYFFLSFLLYLLYRYSFGFKTPLWLIPLILLLWANCHSLFVLGWVCIISLLFGIWFRDKKIEKKFLIFCGISFLTPFLNTYFIKGVLFPFTLLTRFKAENPFAQSIGEFVSPFILNISESFPFYPKIPIFSFRLLAILSIFSLIPIIIKRLYWVPFLFLFFFPLSAKMIRNIPLFIIVSLPALVWAIPFSSIYKLKNFKINFVKILNYAIFSFLTLFIIITGLRVLTDAYYLSSRRVERTGWNWNRMALPVDASEFIKKNEIKGPVLNHLNFGGFLMWATGEKVFIDGRLEVVGEEFYKKYQEIMNSEDALEIAQRKYGFEYIIFPYAIAPRLLERLSKNENYKLIYYDNLSAIFIRKDSKLKFKEELPEISEKKILKFDEISDLGGGERKSKFKRWIEGIFKKQEFPTDYYNYGLFWYFQKDYKKAEKFFKLALSEGGDKYYEIYLNLGSALFQQKKYEDALSCYEIVLRENPENKIAKERIKIISNIRLKR